MSLELFLVDSLVTWYASSFTHGVLHKVLSIRDTHTRPSIVFHNSTRTYVRVRVQELKESKAHAHQLEILDLSYYSNLGKWEKKARQVGPSQCNFQPHETYYASQIRERFVFYVVIYSFAFVKNLVRAGDHWKCENIRLSESTKYPAAGSDLGNCELTFECFFTSSMNPVDFCTVIGERRPVFLPFFLFLLLFFLLPWTRIFFFDISLNVELKRSVS